MPVVDTSAWIEYLSDTDLGRNLAAHIVDVDACVVPTIVQLELYKWLSREVSVEAAESVIGYTQTCIVVPLDTEIALRAAELCRAHKLATADAIVYATSQVRETAVVTCDAHFQHLDGVIYHSKVAS